jgi:hypothetical protein
VKDEFWDVSKYMYFISTKKLQEERMENEQMPTTISGTTVLGHSGYSVFVCMGKRILYGKGNGVY